MAWTAERPLQAAAIPIRCGHVCLVTTSSGRGWIIPKGHVPDGVTPSLLAASEAWEEAGLMGRIDESPLCALQFPKHGRTQDVQVFLMDVTRVVNDWPERRLRRRIWLSPEDAARRIRHESLRSLLIALPSALGTRWTTAAKSA